MVCNSTVQLFRVVDEKVRKVKGMEDNIFSHETNIKVINCGYKLWLFCVQCLAVVVTGIINTVNAQKKTESLTKYSLIQMEWKKKSRYHMNPL